MNEFQYDGEIPADMAQKLARKSRTTIRVDSVSVDDLGFDAEEVAANRAGRLSQRQLDVLFAHDRIARDRSLPTIIGVLGVSVVSASASLFAELEISLRCVGLVFAVITVGYAAVLFYASWKRPTLYSQDLRDCIATSVSGQVILDPSLFRCTIGTISFGLPKYTFLRMRHLGYYTIYYLPQCGMLLSVEPLEFV